MSEVKANTRKTVRIGPRIFHIPNDWQTVQLRDVIAMSGSGEWGEEESDSNTERALVLRSGNITLDGNLSTTDIATRYLSENEYKKHAIKPLDIVIVSSSGSERHIGKKWLAPESLSGGKYHYTNFLYRIRLEESICSPRFIYYFLCSDYERTFIESITPTSTGLQNLDTDSYEEMNLSFPPLAEQRHIADILSTVDEEIRRTEEIIETVEELKTGLMQDLFTVGASGNEETRSEKLLEIPANWDVQPLTSFTIDSSYGPRFSSEEYDQHGNIATLRTTDLDENGDISHESMPLADLNADDFREHFLEKDDFIISRSGANCGLCTVWDGFRKPTVPGAYMIRFRLADELNPEYLREFINSDKGQRRVRTLRRGSSQKNLAGSDLLSMAIPVPSREEQDQVVEIAESVNNRIDVERERRDKLQQLKRGLMQDLLTGKVRVNDLPLESN